MEEALHTKQYKQPTEKELTVQLLNMAVAAIISNKKADIITTYLEDIQEHFGTDSMNKVAKNVHDFLKDHPRQFTEDSVGHAKTTIGKKEKENFENRHEYIEILLESYFTKSPNSKVSNASQSYPTGDSKDQQYL